MSDVFVVNEFPYVLFWMSFEFRGLIKDLNMYTFYVVTILLNVRWNTLLQYLVAAGQTEAPTEMRTETPTQSPTDSPIQSPTDAPTQSPTETPTGMTTSLNSVFSCVLSESRPEIVAVCACVSSLSECTNVETKLTPCLPWKSCISFSQWSRKPITSVDIFIAQLAATPLQAIHTPTHSIISTYHLKSVLFCQSERKEGVFVSFNLGNSTENWKFEMTQKSQN